MSGSSAPTSTTRGPHQPGGIPTAWGAAGRLLAEQAATLGTRSPLNTALLETQAPPAEAVDLSAIWTLPQQPGRPQSRLTLRRLDDKGRLQLPLELPPSAPSRLTVPAERDGAVLSLFLPGAPDRPAPARTMAALPLDERGRLTVTAPARHELGWSAGTEIIATFDPDRRVLTLCAASTVEDAVLAAIDAARFDHSPTGSPAESPAPSRSALDVPGPPGGPLR